MYRKSSISHPPGAEGRLLIGQGERILICDWCTSPEGSGVTMGGGGGEGGMGVRALACSKRSASWGVARRTASEKRRGRGLVGNSKILASFYHCSFLALLPSKSLEEVQCERKAKESRQNCKLCNTPLLNIAFNANELNSYNKSSESRRPVFCM